MSDADEFVDELFVPLVGAWLAVVAVSAVGSVVEDVVDCSSRGVSWPSVEVDCSFSGSRDIGCSGGGAANAPAANSSAVGNRARVKGFLFMAYSSSVKWWSARCRGTGLGTRTMNARVRCGRFRTGSATGCGRAVILVLNASDVTPANVNAR